MRCRLPNIRCNSGLFPPGAAAGLKNDSGLKAGVTLVELMVVVVIMAIVASAAFAMFQSTARHEANQQNILEQNQNLRAALYAVSADARMAGSGLALLGVERVQVFVPNAIINPDVQDGGNQWFRYAGENDYGVRAIFGTDSGGDAGRSDSLSIFRSEVETTIPMSRLSADYNPGTSATLTLQDSVTEGDVISDGDILAIADGVEAVIVQASLPKDGTTADINIGPRFRPAAGHPNGLTFPAGSSVYNLRNVAFVTYYVDRANMRLVADYHDETFNDDDPSNMTPHLVTVANNIEDFQVAYYYFQRGQTGLAPPTGAINGSLLTPGQVWIQAVQLGLVSRSRNISGVGGPGKPIELMGHTPDTEDGFTRRVLTEMIQLRNSESGT